MSDHTSQNLNLLNTEMQNSKKNEETPYIPNELDLACQSGDIQKVSQLLGTENAYCTLIDYAIKSGNLELVKFLHSKGASVISSHINIAIKEQKFEILKYLIANGATPIYTHIDSAIELGNLKLVKCLYSEGASITSSHINLAINKPKIHQFLITNYKK